ncbi:MAG: hemerythrin [Bacteroidia bacterium]|jgi:hemerythrin
MAEREVHTKPMLKTSDIIWQDAQHQVLFEILDLIKQPGSVSRVIIRLRDYTETHFEFEERYMLALDFPDREEHVHAHNQFRREIDLLLKGGEPDAQFRELIATFLSQWLRRHVFDADKKLEAYILDADGSRDSVHFPPEAQVHQGHQE